MHTSQEYVLNSRGKEACANLWNETFTKLQSLRMRSQGQTPIPCLNWPDWRKCSRKRIKVERCELKLQYNMQSWPYYVSGTYRLCIHLHEFKVKRRHWDLPVSRSNICTVLNGHDAAAFLHGISWSQVLIKHTLKRVAKLAVIKVKLATISERSRKYGGPEKGRFFVDSYIFLSSARTSARHLPNLFLPTLTPCFFMWFHAGG